MNKYLIYIRFSTELQDGETQLRLCKERIESIQEGQEYSLEVFRDEDMSSGIAYEKRTQLQNMLSSITPQSTVIVYKLDRLSRDIIEMVTIYRLITKTCGKDYISQ